MKLLIERKFEVYWCLEFGQGFNPCVTFDRQFDTREEAQNYADEKKKGRMDYPIIKVNDTILREIKG